MLSACVALQILGSLPDWLCHVMSINVNPPPDPLPPYVYCGSKQQIAETGQCSMLTMKNSVMVTVYPCLDCGGSAFTRLKAGSRFVVMYEQSETMTSRGEGIMCAATLRPSVEKKVCKVGLNSSMR